METSAVGRSEQRLDFGMSPIHQAACRMNLQRFISAAQ